MLAGSVTVRGSVLDVDTRAPIAGAMVATDEGERVTTSADGSFSIVLPYGPPFLTIEAPGYVRWNQRVPVTPVPMVVRTHLKKVDRSQSVGPAGGSISVGEGGDVNVEFPPGALASEAVVELAYIPPAQIEVLPGRLQWVSQDQHYSIVAAVSVIAPPLARTAFVRFPRFGWPTEELVIAAYDPTTNAWSERYPAVSSDASTVSFEVPHFSIWAAVRQVRREQGRPKVVRVEGDVSAFVQDQPAAIEAGTLLAPEMVIQGTAGASMTVVGPDGSMHAVEGPWQLENHSGVLNLMYGQMRYWTIKLLQLIETPADKYLRTRDRCVGGVRGTVATVRVTSCPGSPSVHHVEYEATESPIEVSCDDTYLGRVEPGETIGAYVDSTGLSDLAACQGCTGGASCPDASALDAGVPDGMQPDAEPWDASMPDAGGTDAGLDDGGIDDAATDASTTGPWIVALETGTLSVGPGGTGAGQVDLANAADFSPYPASAAGPFDTFGEVSLTTASGVIPFAYHARAWSQTAGVPGTGYVTLKTTTFGGRSSAAWTSGSPRSASSIWIMAAATNVFSADVTAPIATVAVTHRSASGVDSVDEYVVRLGDHVRSYVRSTEFDYITDAPNSATEVYAGPCANLGATLPECFLDAFEIPLNGPHALEPITSIRIHAERVFEPVNLASIYGSFRIHAITTMP